MADNTNRGRPRDADTEQRVIDAALILMARHGYGRMSMDQVAEEAGVTKPTIYRRYKSKEDLAVAALVRFCSHTLPEPSGELRADLIAQLRDFRAGVERPFGMAMIGTVLAEEHDTPRLLALFRERMIKPRRAALHKILASAQKQGAVAQTADLNLAAAALIGTYYAQYLGGASFARDWAEQVVDQVLSGICSTSR